MAAWLTQKDVDDYGHDVLDLAQRAAMHAVTPELQRINAQLAAEQRRGLYQSLDTMVPNWREIDNSPQWRQWLSDPHELSGHTRQQWLNDAMARGDAARVASFFRGFLAEAGQSPQRQSPPQAGTIGGSGRVYSREDIKRASKDYLRGRISEADYQKLSADMHAAVNEGRISNPPIPKGKAPNG